MRRPECFPVLRRAPSGSFEIRHGVPWGTSARNAKRDPDEPETLQNYASYRSFPMQRIWDMETRLLGIPWEIHRSCVAQIQKHLRR